MSFRELLRIMKIFTFLMLVAVLHTSARTSGQTITLSGKDLPLKKVFAAIKEQTGYVVFYNQDLLKDAKKVTLTVYDMPLNEFLDITLRDQAIAYTIEDKTILLAKKEVDISGTVLMVKRSKYCLPAGI